MPGVIADAGELGDDHRDPFQGPQVSLEAVRLGALEQSLLHLGELGGRQLGVRAGRPPTAQGIYPALLEARVPDRALWRDTPSS